MKLTSQHVSSYLPWFLVTIVITLPIIAWLQTYGSFSALSTSTTFPLLGVWAWIIMWTHYALGWMRLRWPYISPNLPYKRFSMWAVLLLILLHPGLLMQLQLSRLGAYPPKSFYLYVSESLSWAISLGLIALVLFLSYEVVVRLKHRATIKRIWPWISVSQLLAMLFIFMHGLAVGKSVLHGWMYWTWIVLAGLLLWFSISIIKNDFLLRHKQEAASNTKKE